MVWRPMRAILVNHCHPDCPHVCGTRAREFANTLARQGHRIVLLTETLRRDDAAPDLAALSKALAVHDWAQPFRLAIPPQPAPILQALRASRLPEAVRAVVIVYQYLVRGGMFTDWRDASRRYWQVLAKAFQPDVTWGVFGNTDAWAIAQGIARQAGCPWARDIKDQWTVFVPALFRQVLAWRFADAAATTALSRANAEDAAAWLPEPATAIHSGVPDELVSAPRQEAEASGSFRITLVGGIYDTEALKNLIAGLALFLASSRCGGVEFDYAGTDGERIRRALQTVTGMSVQVHGQLPFAAYWRLIARSHVNVYLRTPNSGWWHHKIVELLAVRRPILCIPGEIDEARELAQRVHGQLISAATPAATSAALQMIWRAQNSSPPEGAAELKELSWDVAARRLAQVLAAVGRG